MPVTIGVFVEPGEPGRRNIEYDAFSDAYATFLLTEILPAVQSRYAMTDDPDRWAIGGGRSGGAARSRPPGCGPTASGASRASHC
jgi:enterochelin esterase family protein